MTDFEIASLAFQEMAAWAAVVAAVAAVVVGSAQCLLIWKGLRLMDRSNRERAVALEQQSEADERRHAEVMEEGARRHAEAMAAHTEAMEESARRHAEAMAAHTEAMAAHAEAMAARAEAAQEGARRHAEAMEEGARRHAEAMAALKTLIERTAPAATR